MEQGKVQRFRLMPTARSERLSSRLAVLPQFSALCASFETKLKDFCFPLQAREACSCIHKSFIISAFGEAVYFQISTKGRAAQEMRSSSEFSGHYKPACSAFT